ncbi:MAG: hypothetical protein JWM95_2444 [Gemmatimonadetes bacterium]|nr:hypothetical protein [Gemmatimonadota bacterium]
MIQFLADAIDQLDVAPDQLASVILMNPILRRILTGTENPLDLRRILDDGQLLLVNLDKGRIGEDAAVALGSFLVSHLSLAGDN